MLIAALLLFAHASGKLHGQNFLLVVDLLDNKLLLLNLFVQLSVAAGQVHLQSRVFVQLLHAQLKAEQFPAQILFELTAAAAVRLDARFVGRVLAFPRVLFLVCNH